MTTPAAPQTLEQRISARLHESIGDLVTDADLKAMVERGIEEALFKPRVAEKKDYYGRVEHKPSVVDELVAKYLEAKMHAAVEAWMEANPVTLEGAIEQAMVKGAGACMIAWMDSRMAGIFEYGLANLRNQGLLPRAPGT